MSGVDERNRFALRIQDETGGGGRGANVAIRCLGREDAEDLRERYDYWASLARSVQDRLHRYAHASLFYRSKEHVYEPEPALRLAAEATIAGYLLAADERWRRLGPSVEHLDLALTRLLGTIAEQYLGDDVAAALASPSPGDEDCRYVEAVGDDLRRGLKDAPSADHDERAVTLAFRCRTALTQLDKVTGWSEDDSSAPEWSQAAGQQQG